MSIQYKFVYCTISSTKIIPKIFQYKCAALHIINRISSLNRSASPPLLLLAVSGRSYDSFFPLLCCQDYARRIQLDVPILKFQSIEQILIYVYNTKKQAGILHTTKSKKGEVLCLKALGRNE